MMLPPPTTNFSSPLHIAAMTAFTISIDSAEPLSFRGGWRALRFAAVLRSRAFIGRRVGALVVEGRPSWSYLAPFGR